MKATFKVIIIIFCIGFTGCKPYEDFLYDYDRTTVYFGTQQPLRTLVSRVDQDYLTFKIGVALGGVRENKKNVTAEFTVDPTLLTRVTGADKFTLLPEDCYTIESNDKTFTIMPGKFLGDCSVKINKKTFANLAGSLANTYALPLKLLKTSADSITKGKDYSVIVIKYVDEHSGAYYTKGSQAQWNGISIVPGTSTEYSNMDLSKNKIRLLTTQSLTQFDMAGMGSLGNSDGTAPDADHLLVNLLSGNVTLSSKPGSNAITDRGSSYNANTKTFTFNYIYTKGGKSYLVNETLELRQDVEKELRFETW